MEKGNRFLATSNRRSLYTIDAVWLNRVVGICCTSLNHGRCRPMGNGRVLTLDGPTGGM